MAAAAALLRASSRGSSCLARGRTVGVWYASICTSASPPLLSSAISLLLSQEAQGIAADSSADPLLSSVLLNARLCDAMHAWFEAQVSAANDTSGRADAFSSLVYACVKMRRLEDAFRARERMEQQRLPVSSRVLASLLKGCGRAREVRRGEALFDSLPPHAADTVVYNAMINMYAHQRLRPLTLSAAQ
eukprot:scaffold186297_cov31-Tisochrysis_lutea.AAC.1